MPLEHLPPQLRFGLLDPLADGADRHAEFPGRQPQRAETPDGLDRAKPAQMNAAQFFHIEILNPYGERIHGKSRFDA